MSVRNMGILVFVFLFGPMLAYAETVEVQCFLMPQTGYIGDLFTYKVVLTKESASILDVVAEFDPALELVSQSSDVKPGKPQKTLRYTYVLRSFVPGEYTLAPPSIYTPEGQRVEYSAEALILRIESLLTEEIDDIKGLKPAGTVGFTLQQLLTIMTGVLTLLLGLYLFLRLRKPRPHVEGDKQLPAHVIAYGILDELRKSDLIGQGRIQEYYVRLSACLRSYIEARFAIRVLEMTTEEFLHNLQGASFLERSQKKALQRFLAHCDLVKFAGYQPEEAEALRAYQLGKAFIDETRDESSVL